MADYSSQDFLRGDTRTQVRTLAVAGVCVVVAAAIVIAGFTVVYPAAKAPTGATVHFVVPALGPGIKSGSKVLLHGAEVGDVTDISPSPSGGQVRVAVVLNRSTAASLTDSLSVDFVPQNYFGVTAMNLTEGSGGHPLDDGETIIRTSAPDFTMSTMLERGSLVVNGTLTDSIIDGLNKVMRYANGLSPLIRAGIIVADNVGKTQRELPSDLFRRVNNGLDVFPAFTDQTMRGLCAISESPYNKLPDGSRGVDEQFHKLTDDSLGIAGSDLFGKAGGLLASHAAELTPLVTVLKYLLDPVPQIIGGGATVSTFREALSGLEGSFRGSGSQKTLQLRVVLDSLPALSTPLQQANTAAQQQRGPQR